VFEVRDAKNNDDEHECDSNNDFIRVSPLFLVIIIYSPHRKSSVDFPARATWLIDRPVNPNTVSNQAYNTLKNEFILLPDRFAFEPLLVL
jgi:hypothetical protein